ncbi:MAG: phosphatase domain-containing protein [Bacteroidota bacterium]
MFQKDKLTIHCYRGFLSPMGIFLHGRVLEDEHIRPAAKDRRLRTLWNNFKRFESDEVPDAQLEITIGDQRFELLTDREGFFTLEAPLKWSDEQQAKAVADGWTEAQIRLLSAPGHEVPGQIFKAPIMVPNPKAAYGVISDIDDTVLQTFVSGRLKLRMLYHSFLKNPWQRRAMEGIVPFYKALRKGPKESGTTPIFYLSDSPWNIYDSLTTFMQVQDLPKGPIFLRDYGWPVRSNDNYRGHKLHYLEKVFRAFPDMSFVLLGDTASHDADYYLQMAQEFPNRVKRIYIRKTRDSWNAKRITKMVRAAKKPYVKLILSTAEMEVDARQLGLIE